MIKSILGFLGVSFGLASVVSWFTHVIHCLSAGKYLLLLVGAIIPPVGMIHGVGIWFGAGW